MTDMQGMAMGAQSTIVDTLHIFIAIIAHKGLAAYALGSSVVDSGATPRRYWTVIAAFALATPVGISLGRVVASFSSSSAAASLSALASGTVVQPPAPDPNASICQALIGMGI